MCCVGLVHSMACDDAEDTVTLALGRWVPVLKVVLPK